MFSIRTALAVSLASFFAALSAHADGRCIVAQLDAVDSNRPKETLIIADHLEIPASGKESWWQSNDGKVKVQIKRLVATAANSEIQASILVNDVLVMRATGRATGNFLGTATSFTVPDGRSFSLTCVAQPGAYP